MLRKHFITALAVILAVAIPGCHLQNVDGNFVLINESSSTVQLLISGNSVGPVVGPQSSSGRFHAKMPMPSDQSCSGTYSTGPNCNPYYRLSSVSVQVYDFTRRRVTDQTSCTAGENAVLTVTYTVYGTPPYEYLNIGCQTQSDRAPVRDTLSAK